MFREVRRVLRDDGVLWLNYGDAYAAKPPGCGGASKSSGLHGHVSEKYRATLDAGCGSKRSSVPPGYKPKDLIGLPWMLAFALRADGWWLRSDIIWHKPNPMPESVTDRPTKAHEYVFLLSKSARYFYDAEAIREEAEYGRRSAFRGGAYVNQPRGQNNGRANAESPSVTGSDPSSGRNARTVWTINPQPTPEAHFATFPEELAERCIKAGTSAYGACSDCGAPWLRVVEMGAPDVEHQRACGGGVDGDYAGAATKDFAAAGAQDASAVKARILAGMRERVTTGWKPTCECEGAGLWVRPCVVLDPFAGSGTTLLVAERLGRDSLGIELNPEYIAIAERRIKARDPTATIELAPGVKQASLFTGDMP